MLRNELLYRVAGMLNDFIWMKQDFESRAVTPENPTGTRASGAMAESEPGHTSERLGKGWKCRPCVGIQPGETATLCDISGPGMIKHIWMTCDAGNSPRCLPWNEKRHRWRSLIFRIYWDGQDFPSVECPVGDFFACGLEEFAQIDSAVVTVNPGQAFNCWWDMPFLKGCRMTLENRSDAGAGIFYQIDYQERDLPAGVLYFHSQFRRSNPTIYKTPHVILDGVTGIGKYVGTYMTWTSNSGGWWGEGEVKFYIDGDKEYPTICGTGTEDYFCGSNNFENTATGQYQDFSTLYTGMPQIIRPDGVYRSQTRFGLYRWHIQDPVAFKSDIRVDIQALGWSVDGRYRCLNDDVSSVAYWYQVLPTVRFPQLGTNEELELV